MPETEYLLSSPANAERLKAAIRGLERPSLIARIRSGWSFLLTKLNALGSILLAYALLNPSAASELLDLLPPQYRTGAALGIPVAWFCLVQYAKMKAIKKAAKPSNQPL